MSPYPVPRDMWDMWDKFLRWGDKIETNVKRNITYIFVCSIVIRNIKDLENPQKYQ